MNNLSLFSQIQHMMNRNLLSPKQRPYPDIDELRITSDGVQ